VAVYDVQQVRELLEGGADPNGTSGQPIPFAEMHWTAPFEQALRINASTEMIRLFLAHGGDVTCHDPDAGLIQAVVERDAERVRKLLGKGAKVDRPCSSVNLTPLLAAISIDSPELIRLLVENGAKVNTTKKVRGGWQLPRPLCHAVENDRADSVATLLELDADVEAVDHLGYPALFKAVVRKPNPQIVKKLLDAGADANRQVELPRGLPLFSESPARRRKREQTPLLYAERKLHQLESMDDTMKAKVGPAYPDFLQAYTAAVELLRRAAS
jgi:ankyrin repeat protein